MPNLKHKAKSSFIPEIDTFRAISIILVIAFHSNIFDHTFLKNSTLDIIFKELGIGVNCFFVISGYLITGILLNTLDHISYYKNFFVRRILRIFPLYYLILFIAFIILPHFDHPKTQKWSNISPFWYWTYLSNYYIAYRTKFTHGLVDLSWSLSIEEQFYIIWPFIIKKFYKFKLHYICILGVLISIVARLVLKIYHYSDVSIHVLTFCQFDGLLIGALLLLYQRNYFKMYKYLKKKKLILLIALIYITMIFVKFPGSVLIKVAINETLIAIIFAYFIHFAVREGLSKTKYLFNNQIINNIGTYSYGIYLTHNAIQSALRYYIISKISFKNYFLVITTQIAFIVTVLFISYHISKFIFKYYESLFLKYKIKFNY